MADLPVAQSCLPAQAGVLRPLVLAVPQPGDPQYDKLADPVGQGGVAKVVGERHPASGQLRMPGVHSDDVRGGARRRVRLTRRGAAGF
jgi:hypothetical protein